MNRIIQYKAHNILTGTESPVEDYAPQALQAMEANGVRFIAIDEYGARSIVPWDKVENPIPDAARYVPYITFLRFAEAVVSGDAQAVQDVYIQAVYQYAENNGLEVIQSDAEGGDE